MILKLFMQILRFLYNIVGVFGVCVDVAGYVSAVFWLR